MIQVAGCEPVPEVRRSLRAWQAEVDASRKPYRSHIRAADDIFSRRRAQVAFAPVTELLRAMGSGVERCMYCQDSVGVDVEHYRPKAWYPELVFAWANFLLICSRCNRKKGSRFPLFSPTPTSVRALTRLPGAVPRRPPVADPVLLNPRVDDPAEHLTLDLTSTFLFAERGATGTPSKLRAAHTIEVLGLNDDHLTRSRRSAYQAFVSHLRVAGSARTQGDAAEMRRAREAVATVPCGAVWREMQRQRNAHTHLLAAFTAVPEALDW